ncbi:MAG: nucleoside triphosphate pyrophosphohydrolase [Rhodospirillales bacterium]
MSNIDQLLAIMERLRDPDGGCPWDIVQTFATIAPYTVEEAYEVADAVSRNHMADLRDELGDLLLQVVFHAQMAKEAGAFSFAAVVDAICDKMLRRHPHVFADGDRTDATAQTAAWERHKAAERAAARSITTPAEDGSPTEDGSTEDGGPAAGGTVAVAPPESLLDGIPTAMPAMIRAVKLQKRATLIGFDWPDAAGALAKLSEEIAELESELETATDTAAIADELGDVLFSCANLARKLGLDPDQALRQANSKFERRFRKLEVFLNAESEGKAPVSLDVLEQLWQRAKRET